MCLFYFNGRDWIVWTNQWPAVHFSTFSLKGFKDRSIIQQEKAFIFIMQKTTSIKSMDYLYLKDVLVVVVCPVTSPVFFCLFQCCRTQSLDMIDDEVRTVFKCMQFFTCPLRISQLCCLITTHHSCNRRIFIKIQQSVGKKIYIAILGLKDLHLILFLILSSCCMCSDPRRGTVAEAVPLSEPQHCGMDLPASGPLANGPPLRTPHPRIHCQERRWRTAAAAGECWAQGEWFVHAHIHTYIYIFENANVSGHMSVNECEEV